MSDYIGNLLILVLLYSVLSSTLTVLIGQAGLFSVAHALFFGIGGYVTGLLMIKQHWPWVPAIIASMVLGAVVAMLVATISMRVHEDYLVIASFGLQVIGSSLLVNLSSVTGGVAGVADIPLPTLFGWSVSTVQDFVYLSAGTAVVCVAAIVGISRSHYGRVVKACRDDPIAAAALGKRPALYKISIFAITSAIAAFAGGVYAFYRGFISPDDFTVDLSILVLVMVVIGGLGKISGAMLGAILIVVLPELVRRLDLAPSLVGPIEQVIYGIALIVVVLIRPEGLITAWPDHVKPRTWIRSSRLREPA